MCLQKMPSDIMVHQLQHRNVSRNIFFKNLDAGKCLETGVFNLKGLTDLHCVNVQQGPNPLSTDIIM
jgi:hypothetical protein